MKKTLLIFFIFLNGIVSAQDGEFTELKHLCKDGIERPYIVYAPKNIQKNNSIPLLVYLHGAVSSSTLKDNPLEYIQKSKWVELADKGGFYLLFPYGQEGATWFDTVGTTMIMEEIESVKKRFPINENKVFLSGFSDGGSGVYYIAMTNPDPFAGFISMNGSFKIAIKISGSQLYPENMNRKPFYIINTQNDMLYPVEQMRLTTEYLKRFNPNIIFKSPKGNHEMSYLEGEEQGNILNFIAKECRSPLTKVSWETTNQDGDMHTISFLSITQPDYESTIKSWHHPYSLKIMNNKADLGIKYDYSFKGKGVKIKDFKSDTVTASRLGLKKGDIILLMEKDTMTSLYSPFYYISKKKAGDPTSLTVIRDGKRIAINGNFNEGYFYEVFNYKENSAKIEGEVNSESLVIKTSRVKEFIIDFSQLLNYKIQKVIVNGKELYIEKQGQQTIKVN